MTQNPPPAGWYPSDHGERYWDGTAWTAHTRPAPQFAAGPPAAPAYYAPQQPAKTSHTARNILLVFAVLFVLLVGGCVAVIGLAANEVDQAIDEEIAADKAPGGPDNPLEITPGEAFEVSDFDYAAGWSVVGGPVGLDIKGLKVTNNRDETDGAFVDIKLWKGTEVLASASCSTDQIAVGTTEKVSCLSGDDLPRSYDKVTINDSF